MPALAVEPDLLVVQGDTSSAMGGALAGFECAVAVAHVEAGLRTHDPLMPWPEEGYRTAIDARADLLFAPTEVSAGNLRREGVPGAIHVTGNTGIDALRAVLGDLPSIPTRERTPRILTTCHRRENWAGGLTSLCAALAELAADGSVEIEVITPPNVHVAAEMRRLLARSTQIRLGPPCGHRELIERMRGSDLILSDSGGMQEEAPVLGVPLLILREKTERPEVLATGNMELVGTDKRRIVSSVKRLLNDPVERSAMAQPAFPYGDGWAAPRIAAIINQWLEANPSK